MENFLKQKNIRVTPFRLSVLEIFSANRNAITVEQIESGLQKFDRITLYRTIKTFIDKGIIHEIVMPGNTKKLALCPETCGSESHDHIHDHHHLHFKCDNCEEVYCIDLPNTPQISIPGFAINQLEIQGTGVCQSCNK